MKKVGYFVIGLVLFSLVISSFSILGVFYKNCFAQPITWERVDLVCDDKIHEKTLCYEGGLDQCTKQTCPPPQ